MTIHDLKTWPEFFEALIAGTKLFELRHNDRGFEVGDELCLREWEPLTEQYTGRKTSRRVIYLLEYRPGDGCAATYGLREDYVILGLSISSTHLDTPKPPADMRQIFSDGDNTHRRPK